MVQNKQVVFRKIPVGLPEAGKDLVLETSQIDLNNVPQGGVITKNYFVSFDPYQRGRLRDSSIKSYVPAYEIGHVITNGGIAKIVKSANEEFKEGDLVVGHVGTSEYSVVTEPTIKMTMKKIHNPYNLPLSHFIGVLGMPGLTAYSSFYEIGQPKKGETIFVSAAGGAVGGIVGQLSKREGLRVIGSVGSDEKVDFVKNQLGFDDAFNYKKISPKEALEKYAPEGINIYFDNVGGETLAAVIDHSLPHARLIECGMISQYNLKSPEEAYKFTNLTQIMAKRLRIQGFIVGDENMGGKYAKEHNENVSKWLANGEFVARETITEGIDNAIEGFIGMLQGKNFGKAMVKIASLD